MPFSAGAVAMQTPSSAAHSAATMAHEVQGEEVDAGEE
eukprot:gene37018-20773_t